MREVERMFAYVNGSPLRCYVANLSTLGLYGAVYVICKQREVAQLRGLVLPGPAMALLLTVLTLGIYPAVMLSVLAYKLGPASLGHTVFALNAASAVTAFSSFGALLVASVLLWSSAVWLVVQAANIAHEGVPA
jgi:hypothetical protein